ncbi:MAG TPA: FAD-dependent oxidoreductase, partial [Devosia sp.]|nr:FAD-dependent oxidoreductase [Devosia sp.]
MGIFVEAESFKNLGGWGVDQQSLRQMGSAYLIAHGNGIPVEDAETKIEVPEFGTWHVWVRTRDWTAIWGRGSPGGVFQLLVNGAALPSILGTNGTKWDWQKAGAVTLREGKASLALHDLTGFNGRCDAIYLTKDASFTPPNGKDELATFRDGELGIVLKDDPVEYDLVVAGGGVAGVCTAVSAIRSGLKVVILQDRGVLGGCNSSEIRVGLGGMFHSEPYMNLGNVVKEIAPIFGGHGTYSGEFFEDSRKANIFRLHEKDGNRLILNHHVVEVETAPDDPQRIVSVIAVSTLTGERTRFKGKQFADCTGDALLARALGCEYMYGTESRDTFNESLAPVKGSNQVMGQTL